MKIEPLYSYFQTHTTLSLPALVYYSDLSVINTINAGYCFYILILYCPNRGVKAFCFGKGYHPGYPWGGTYFYGSYGKELISNEFASIICYPIDNNQKRRLDLVTDFAPSFIWDIIKATNAGNNVPEP